MKRQLNHFEAQAHDVQYRKKNRISYPHNINTYTGNNTKSDFVTVASVCVIVAMIIVAFIKL